MTLRLLAWPAVELMRPLLKLEGGTCLERAMVSSLDRRVVIWRQEEGNSVKRGVGKRKQHVLNM